MRRAANVLGTGLRICVGSRQMRRFTGGQNSIKTGETAAVLNRRRHKLAAIIADVTEDTGVGGPNPLVSEYRERAALNSRETDVLRFLVQGFTNKEIAARMDISESAVKNTLQQLFAKTSVRTRSQLVRVALEQYRSVL
jgi:DNA-binding NarL/FixJ family response regulator